MMSTNFLGASVTALADLSKHHSPSCTVYEMLNIAAKQSALNLFGEGRECVADMGPYGELALPFYSMGAISSLHLFGLDELILFSFYHLNRNKYKHAADIGGNIGLHSILLAKAGYQVRTYEPDPIHVEKIKSNMQLNGSEGVEVIQAAVSNQEGEAEFVRVLGNTTGSHLAGAKENPYGDLNRFQVKLVDLCSIMQWADLIKIDAEGQEAKMLMSTTYEDWQATDAIVEVGSAVNADDIFKHFEKTSVNLFAQKTGWERVVSRDQMPKSYKDGSLFISCADKMLWR